MHWPPSTVPMGPGNTEKQLQMMMDMESTVLCATSSYALLLAEAIEARGIKDRIHLRKGVIGSERWSEKMRRSIEEGLSTAGTLPGGLGVERKARHLYGQRHIDESAATRENRIVCAYAFAAAEQNADCGTIVTGYKNSRGDIKVECRRCQTVMIRTLKTPKHDIIKAYAPEGMERIQN